MPVPPTVGEITPVLIASPAIFPVASMVKPLATSASIMQESQPPRAVTVASVEVLLIVNPLIAISLPGTSVTSPVWP